MIILDTNVISEPMRATPDLRVLQWLDGQDLDDLWLTAIAAAELQAGVEKLIEGERRWGLQQQITALLDEFDGRILPFDLDAALAYGTLVGPSLRTKQKIQTMDYQIAAIARVHGAAIATRNVRDFEGCGVELIDPWSL